MVEEWRLAALCAQTDPESFYPAKGGPTKYPLLICSRCEVTDPCLADALEVETRLGGEPSGVRGGKTARQRALMIRAARKRQAVGGAV